MKNNDYEINHIKVLDGIRALAIIIIVWYHFWQQSWIFHHIGNISLDFIPRYGYLFVEMMILLSSFCLFLPYARSMIYHDDIPNTKTFYHKRIIRILPSYLLSMVIAIIFLIISNKNISMSFFFKDTLTHLFFVHNLFLDTLLSTNYIGVLWTVALEVQFYLIFPYLAKKFMKHPVITYLVMMSIGITSTIIFHFISNDSNISLLVNNPLTFFMVYANGMMGCYLYVKYTKNKKRNTIKDIIFTLVSVSCIFIYKYLCSTISLDIQRWQIDYRLLLSILFTIFIISSILSIKYYRFLLENKLMKFIAVISFNLYIYHQFIAVKLKEFRIPYWTGDTPPNFLGDVKWQWTYFLLCIIISLIVAIIFTYFFEKPITKKLKKEK